MSFLRCWQLRKLKTSDNAHENQLFSDDTTPPYGQENSSVEQKRDPNSKKIDNKTDGKKGRRVGGAFSLIDQFKKTRKKDGGANKSHGDDHVDGRANGVGHQKRAKVPILSGKKVSWDMATASCTDTDDQPQRKNSKGSYDYIDADECHDVVTHHSSTPFYSIRNSNSTRPSSSHHAQMSSSSSPQSRYDYLDFAGKPDQPQQHQLRRQQQRAAPQQRVAVPPPALRRAAASADEPLYATASSQIYSLGGSEDPYSSIVSIGGGYGSGSATYDQHGYSRIINSNKNGTTGLSKATTGVPPATTMLARAAMNKNNANNFAELDQLYAKINRKISAADQQQPTTSAAIAKQLLRQQSFQHQQSTTTTDFGGESGSGSICSSTQPSYRYLTVREDAAVIRERIRLREEQEQQQQSEQQHQQRANLGQQLEQQDHDDAYYSTIGNEYETVGDGNAMDMNLTNGGDVVSVQQRQNGGVGPTSLSSFNSFRQPVPPPPPPQNRLSLNVDFADRTSASSPTPLPPTSPIPKIQPQMLQQQSSNNFHHHHHHNLHHQQQLSSSSTFSTSPSAKVPMPPPPLPPPPPFIRRPVVMPTENLSPSNNAPLTNGRGVTSPKKSSSSALRLSFFNGSPLNFFNNSKVVAEKSVPAPPISPPPKAMPSAAETNGLSNGTGKTDQNGAKKRHHSRIPIFNRHGNVGIHRVRTPSPTTTTSAVSSINCADIGTQTMKHQQQRHQLTNKMPTSMPATTTTTRDKPSSSSSRRSSPLPVQVGQDYVSTIELSKRGGGAAAGGGDQRGWPLKSPTTMTASTSSAC